jgi:hypothetical protein
VLYLAFLLCESLPLSSIHTSYTYLPLDSTAAMPTAYQPSTHALSSIMAHANPQTRCRSWQARPGRFHTSSGVYVSRCRYKRKMTGFKKSIAPHALPSALCASVVDCTVARDFTSPVVVRSIRDALILCPHTALGCRLMCRRKPFGLLQRKQAFVSSPCTP